MQYSSIFADERPSLLSATCSDCVRYAGSGRNPAVKSPLRVSILLLASASCSCLLAHAGEPASPDTAVSATPSEFMIPGPLRSFLRMAGISQKVAPEEVLPLLGRNVYMQ